MINLICDRSLLGVYSSNGTVVNAAVVTKAAQEIFDQYTVKKPWPKAIVFASMAAGIILVLTFLVKNNYLSVSLGEASQQNTQSAHSQAVQAEAL